MISTEISYKSFLRVLAFPLFLSLFAACGSSSSSSDEDSAELPTVMPDTFAVDPGEEEEAKKDSVVKRPQKIRSRQEIAEFIENSPHKAEYQAGIIPTIAEYVPEYASKLLDNESNGFLIVDKNTMKLYRYDKYGRELESVGIACSKRYGTKHKKADNRTPEGFFSIEGIYNSTDWLYTDDNGHTSPAKGQFGPRFMRLRIPNTSQIGIHGTASAGSIGGRRSHGCIRMTNENILRIHKLCSPGMPVIVSPGPRDMAVNESEGFNIPSVPVKVGGRPCVAGKYSEYELERLKDPNAKKAPVAPADSVATPAPADSVSAKSPAPAPEAPAQPSAEPAPAPAAPEPAPASPAPVPSPSAD